MPSHRVFSKSSVRSMTSRSMTSGLLGISACRHAEQDLRLEPVQVQSKSACFTQVGLRLDLSGLLIDTTWSFCNGVIFYRLVVGLDGHYFD